MVGDNSLGDVPGVENALEFLVGVAGIANSVNATHAGLRFSR